MNKYTGKKLFSKVINASRCDELEEKINNFLTQDNVEVIEILGGNPTQHSWIVVTIIWTPIKK